MAVKAMASPLGSPTRSPPPEETEVRRGESEERKYKPVAPQSHAGGSVAGCLTEYTLWAAGFKSE